MARYPSCFPAWHMRIRRLLQPFTVHRLARLLLSGYAASTSSAMFPHITAACGISTWWKYQRGGNINGAKGLAREVETFPAILLLLLDPAADAGNLPQFQLGRSVQGFVGRRVSQAGKPAAELEGYGCSRGMGGLAGVARTVSRNENRRVHRSAEAPVILVVMLVQ